MKILRLCCVEFYKEVKELCGVEPFFDVSLIIIAALSMRIYKSLFMKDCKIGIIPKSSYGNNVNSFTAMFLQSDHCAVPSYFRKIP